MNESLILVTQLPVIEQRLQTISSKAQQDVDSALAVVCTEESLASVKKLRSELNGQYKALEEQRIAVKKQILEPYEAFEDVYKTLITNVYKPADEQLKTRITGIEDELKNDKADKVKAYYTEYAESVNIDFVPFERSGIKVTMTDSLKKLKEQAKSILDGIASDLLLIDTQEHKAEILVEYKKSINVSNAITTVVRRFEEIEVEAKRQQERAEAEEKRKAAAAAVASEIPAAAPLSAPVSAPTPETVSTPNAEIYETTFEVSGTLEQLKALKEFLTAGGYIYVTR